MATETDIATEDRPKVYLETSFMFYLTGRETTDQKIASEQAYTRKWWEEQGSCCHHLANPVTFPKTKRIIESFGLTCPAIITPRSYLEDFRHEG